MSEHSRGAMCGAVRAAAPQHPCPLDPHPATEAHLADGQPWYELPLDIPRQPHPSSLDAGCVDGITSSMSLRMRTEVRHG